MKLYEVINAGNWVQKSGQRLDRHCVAGHVWVVYGRSIRTDGIFDALDRAAALLFPDRIGGDSYRPVVHFNDHPDTTVEDVIRVCKFADV